MLGIMFTLIAVVVLWLAVVRPIDAARASARERLLEATDRHAAIQAKVKMLKALPRVQASGPAVPLEQFVGQSAAEAGLSLEREQAQGDDRIDIAIGSVRPIALFSCLAALEGQGVRVDNMSARPSRSEEHTSELQSLIRIQYAVFCLKKKTKK